MMKLTACTAILLSCLTLVNTAQAEQVAVDLELPVIATGQYQRPYVAVWVERKGERRALTTVAVWHEDKKWLKDLRRWWRKAGRYQQQVDGVSGATRAPGSYQLTWDGKDASGQLLTGEVTLYLESVREHGNRTLFKQTIRLGEGKQDYRIAAGEELGAVNIRVGAE